MHTPVLRDIAMHFRIAIEAIPESVRPIGMKQFPCGACGDASLLLGAYLVDVGIHGFEYICGERGSYTDNSWTSHAWLQRASCVVDITADQFNDAPSPVIVADPSIWHMSFDAEEPTNADFRVFSGYGADVLHPMYARILELLPLTLWSPE